MTPEMQHRGPDDEGCFSLPRLALGMRRLSIIDLEGGHQPILNEDGSVVLVFNGEIYNFQELRLVLEAAGHEFRTNSDSEVILRAYEQWGEGCVERLRGMFAIAIYDRRRGGLSQHSSGWDEDGRLFLARDRFGIKPLYYYHDQNVFLFASEVRALLASGAVPGVISGDGVQSYLLFGSVSEPLTLVDNVFSLPPGHRMLISMGYKVSVGEPEPYWDLDRACSSRKNNGGNEQDLSVARVRELLTESVRLHMIADVQVGVFLSSGIDSTALTALASTEAFDVHTFTISFPEIEYSEAAVARRTAARFGATHKEFMLSGDDLLSRLDEAVAALDQPSGDGINTYFVSWAARQSGLKVALSGLGSDEVFGGYQTFRWSPRLQRLAAFSGLVPRPVRAAMSSLIVKAGAGVRGDAFRKLAAVWGDPSALPHPYFFNRVLFTPDQTAALSSRDGRPFAVAAWWEVIDAETKRLEGVDDFSVVSRLEIKSYLVNTLLRDADSMSMANSLEVRVPFLDHGLVEYVSSLPAKVKDQPGRSKSLLMAAVKDLLPEEVVDQKKKGFTLPWQEWLRGQLYERVDAGLSDISPVLRTVLDAGGIYSVWKDFLAGETNWSRPWSLYVLNEWVKRHLQPYCTG